MIGCQSGAGMLGGSTLVMIFGYIAARTSFQLLPYYLLGTTLTIALLQLVVDGHRS